MAEVVSDGFLTREIRVFLSSTFNDMETERTHLVKDVFPRVRAACAERMVGFTEIDLRWGITEDKAKNGETVEICLAEIDRCRAFPPFFIGFLGERYGWIPDEKAVLHDWATHPGSDYAQLVRKALKRGLSVTEMEMELAALAEGAAERLQGQVLFLLRDPALTDSLYTAATGRAPDRADRRFFEPAGGKLDALKERLRNTPFLEIDGYRSIEEFGAAVETYLLERLDRYFPKESAPTPLEQAKLEHSLFRQNRLRFFLPREAVRDQILTAMRRRTDQPELGPIVLHGPSGQGKSAILADLARHLESHDDDEVHWRVIEHYVGADGVLTLDGWLDRVLETLHLELRDTVGDEIPDDAKERHSIISSWLDKAARQTEQAIGRPVRFALVLDALDQLMDEGRDLNLLLPDVIGPRAVVVASTADETIAADTTGSDRFQKISLPGLTQHEARVIVTELMASYRKTLPEALVTRLVRAPQAQNPLFLQLALEELRVDARHETLEITLDTILACDDAPQLFLNCFLRDSEYQRIGQPDLALHFFALQAASYHGLSEIELSDLLALPDDPIAVDTGRPRLPRAVMSKLVGVFWPFILTKEGRRAPMHRLLGKAALRAMGEHRVRVQLFDYFSPNFNGKPGWIIDLRAGSDSIYQAIWLTKVSADYQGFLYEGLKDPAKLLMWSEFRPDLAASALTVIGHENLKQIAENEWRSDPHSAGEGDCRIVQRLADFLFKKGFYQMAEPLLWFVVENFKIRMGNKHLHTLYQRQRWALSLYHQEKYEFAQLVEAETFEKALREYGHLHPTTLVSGGNFALYLKSQDKLDLSKEIYEKILNSLIETKGHDDEGTITTKLNLSEMYLKLKDLPSARALAEEVLSQISDSSENENLSIAVMGVLASISFAEGDTAEARELQKVAVEKTKRVKGALHPDTLISAFKLCQFLDAEKDHESAQSLLEQIVEPMCSTLGPADSITLAATIKWGRVRLDLGDLIGAKETFSRITELSVEILPLNHSARHKAMGGLATVLFLQGSETAARFQVEKLLEIQIKSIGATEPSTIDSMEFLLHILFKIGDLKDALALQLRFLILLSEEKGDDDPVTLKLSAVTAKTLYGLGKYELAYELLYTFLPNQIRQMGSSHPDTIASAQLFVLVKEALGR